MTSPKSSDGRLPLHLCEVLEEEYVALHGQPTIIRGWDFDRGDFDAASVPKLWKRLRAAPEYGANAFSVHVLERIRATPEAAGLFGDGRDDAERLAGLFNALLGDPELYTPKIASRLPSPRRHEELLPARPSGGTLAGQDLRRFNRVLLEDAYPETLTRIYDIRLRNIIDEIHRTPRTALCLSGGGIRSGTFALGVLQGLASRGLLRHFHYLSTVSGGGYTGSWLSAWCHRHPQGFLGVQEDLARDRRTATIESEAPPLRHLREFSNFVAPRLSLISADIWSFVAIYLRNLLINWSMLLPYLFSVVLIPRVLVAVLHSEWAHATLMGSAFLLGLGLTVLAVLHITLNRPSRADALTGAAFWFQRRGQGAVLRYSIFPTVVSAVCLALFWGWYQEGTPATVNSSGQVVRILWVPIWFNLGLVLLGIGLYLLSSVVAAVIVRRRPKLGDITAAFITGAAGGLLTWLFLRTAFAYPLPSRTGLPLNAAVYVWLAVPAYLLVFFVGATAFVAATSRRTAARNRQLFSIDDEDREWLARHSAWLLVTGCAWLVLSGLAIFGPLLLLQAPKAVAGLGGVSGLIALILGRSARTPASREKARTRTVTELLLEHAMSIAAVIFIGVLLVGLSFFGAWLLGYLVDTWWPHYEPPAVLVPSALVPAQGTDRLVQVRQPFTVGTWNGQLAILYYTPLWLVFGLTVALWAWAVLAARAVNLNRFSLHAAYRARIIRAFLGASRSTDDRDPNPFTGFDPQDNVQMHELRPGLISEVSFLPDQLALFVARLRDSQPSRFVSRLGVRFVPIFERLTVTQDVRRLQALYARLPSARQDSSDAKLLGDLQELVASDGLGTLLEVDERRAAQATGREIFDELFPDVLPDPARARPGEASPPLDALRRRLRNVPYDALYRKLSSITRYRLANHNDLNPPSQSLKRALIEDINRVIETGLPELDPVPALPAAPDTISLWQRVWRMANPPRDAADRAPRRPSPTNAELLDDLPDRGRGEAALLMKRSMLDATFPEFKRLGAPPPPWATHRLMHVVGTALNLVGCKRLAWQHRQAESFTISPLHSGSLFTGYRRTRDYGGPDGVSLGTAATISGAAVSSNMGYHSSSAPVTFVLTLMNARLGWWLGNPGPAGADTYVQAFPTSSLTPMRLEAFGLTDDTSEYVLLSDGGHFDNLGLYEMVLRRCRLILAIDGSQDGEARFDDLGSTIRKVRIDLGIDIEFLGRMDIHKRREPADDADAQAPGDRDKYCAIATIRYSAVDGDDRDGLLIYVKPALYGGEPRDVVNYGAANPDFPHQSTADQLFDEPQFESYRMLGRHVAGCVFGSRTPRTLPDLVDAVHEHVRDTFDASEDVGRLLDAVKTRLGAPPPFDASAT